MSNRPKSQTSRVQQRTTDAPEGARSSLVWIGVAAIVAIAVVVGLLVSLGGDDNSSAAGFVAETGFAEVIGDPLPELAEGADPAVGTPAPTLRAASARTGDIVDVIPDDGNVKMIGFFAHWCPHCQREIPKVVARLAAEPLPTGVEMIAVSTAVDETAPNYPPSAWFAREGWTNEVLVDTAEGAAANGFGLSGFPYWVVVDGDGNVIARTGGELTDAQLDDLIQLATDAV